jgi:iron complex transport system permease protein
LKDQDSISIPSLSPARFVFVNGALFVLLVAAAIAGVLVGPGDVSIERIFPLDPDSNPAAAIVIYTRLDRVWLAALAGAALSVVGVAFQALLRNPLADPFVMGVSGGAALGGTLAMVGLGGLAEGLALEGPAAFAGALCAMLLIYRVGRVGGRLDATTVLLVGVVFNAFASAVITFLKVVVTAQKAQEVLGWLMGIITDYSLSTLAALSPGIIAGIVVLWLAAPGMNALALGESGALELGVPVERLKVLVFFAASLLVGLAVCVTGLVGFVGLMVPHVCRLWLGPDHRLLVPASALAGASFLMLADLLSRLAFVAIGRELPVGVITAFLGGPFFLWLLRRRYRRAFV